MRSLRRTAFLLPAIALCCASAHADAQGAYDWTGFYLGAEGGYGWGRTFSKSLDNGTTSKPPMNGGAGGPFVGFNYQFDNRIGVGIESEASLGNIEGDTDCPNKAFRCFGRVDWLGSTRPKHLKALLGQSVSPSMLPRLASLSIPTPMRLSNW